MKRNRSILIIGILLGLISVFLLNSYIQDIKDQEGVDVEVEVVYVDVLIASETISRNTEIEETMFTSVSVDENNVHPQAVLASDNIIGYYAKYDIVSGEQILYDKLTASLSGIKLSKDIKDGYRAISFYVDEIVGVANYVVAGDMVDILIVYDPDELSEEYNPLYTQLENIEVLKVGPNLGPYINNEEYVEMPSSVTVAVTPSQAEIITLANRNGSFQLTLRNSNDDGDNEKTYYND